MYVVRDAWRDNAPYSEGAVVELTPAQFVAIPRWVGQRNEEARASRLLRNIAAIVEEPELRTVRIAELDGLWFVLDGNTRKVLLKRGSSAGGYDLPEGMPILAQVRRYRDREAVSKAYEQLNTAGSGKGARDQVCSAVVEVCFGGELPPVLYLGTGVSAATLCAIAGVEQLLSDTKGKKFTGSRKAWMDAVTSAIKGRVPVVAYVDEAKDMLLPMSVEFLRWLNSEDAGVAEMAGKLHQPIFNRPSFVGALYLVWRSRGEQEALWFFDAALKSYAMLRDIMDLDDAARRQSAERIALQMQPLLGFYNSALQIAEKTPLFKK